MTRGGEMQDLKMYFLVGGCTVEKLLGQLPTRMERGFVDQIADEKKERAVSNCVESMGRRIVQTQGNHLGEILGYHAWWSKGVGDEIHGLMHARCVLFQLSHIPVSG